MSPARAFRVVLTGECYLEGAQVDSQERVASQMEAIYRQLLARRGRL